MARRRSWFHIVKRFFIPETHPKTEKVDMLLVCLISLLGSTKFLKIFSGKEKEMAVWEVENQKIGLFRSPTITSKGKSLD